MSTQGKVSDAGWFYHAPARVKKTEMVEVPPASQIPGLSDLGPEPPMPPPCAGLIKEGDSKYIQLAKMGGRQNLLKFRDPEPHSEEPVGYPRVNWYYLEDNAAEDEDTKKPCTWEFKLPEYMVHQEYKGNAGKGKKPDPKRPPYTWDKQTAHQRENGKPSDKTVKLPEDKKSGYGVRSGKLDAKQARKEAAAETKESAEDKPPARHQRMSHEEERPNMTKLLSNGYAKEYEQQKKMEEEMRRMELEQREAAAAAAAGTKLDKEAENYKEKSKSASGDCTGKEKPVSADKSTSSKKSEKTGKVKDDIFKMSKFRNVPAKTNSHRT